MFMPAEGALAFGPDYAVLACRGMNLAKDVTGEQVAAALGITATVARERRLAMAWMHRDLIGGGGRGSAP
jgi:hypothetical protein